MAVTVKKISFTLLTLMALAGITFMPLPSNKVTASPTTDEPVSQIIQIETYREIQEVINTCRQSTLVTFDVDNTLIAGNDVLVRTPEPPLLFKLGLAFKYLPSLISTQAREKFIDTFLSTFLQQAPRFIFDPDVVHLIKQLQQQKCIPIGLTALGSGSAGTIASLPAWRTTMLKALDIDFSGYYPDITFTQFPASHNSHPCLRNGIICTNFAPKGAVLGAFLDHYHLTPERIISFDDQRSALDSIAAVCKKRGIPFFGYHIMGANKLPGTWRTRRALLQFETAVDHGRWLSDHEADAILDGTTQQA